MSGRLGCDADWGSRTRFAFSEFGCFFFQAEDGIRDHCVTGVQTCALPICPAPLRPSATATRGPAQQSVETTAATTPPVTASAVLVTDVVMIFQNLQDRAVVRRASSRARRGQPLQRAPHALEIADPLLDDFDLLSGFPLDDIAGGAVPDAQPEQLLNLLQRKTELLGVLDEAEARHRVVGVLAIPCRSAARSRKQATPLVITDRLDVHVGRVRDLTDGQRRHSALH